MFQLWKRVLLCGLLSGTSASLLDSLGKDVLRKLKSGLEKGLDNLDSTLVSEPTTGMGSGTWELAF